MNIDVPTPASNDDDASQESVETLRTKLALQRAHQKATLVKHKRTTFLACETARKGTNSLNARRVRDTLGEKGDEE